MKNKILITLLGLIFTLQICVFAADNLSANEILPPQTEEQVEIEDNTISGEHNLDDDSAPEIVEEEQTADTLVSPPYKNPISKRKLAKKFLLAMFGVALSSFMIFAILTIYNKIREGVLDKTKTLDGDISLDIPDDLNGAVKTFLEKTKW